MLVFVCVRTRVSWGPCVSELTVSQGKQEGRWEGTPCHGFTVWLYANP